MSAQLLLTAQFHTTVVQLAQLPDTGLPEVAFVGRSNAGKSTAINRLCNRNRLAFASRTPGRTQALNYFVVGPAKRPSAAYLVDTPGYGYATAPTSIKKQWDALAGQYLSRREELRGVVLMIDIRRLIGERDVDLVRWIPPHVPILILLTKADKLARMHQQRAADTMRDQIVSLGLPNPISMILFSSLKHTGIDAARGQISDWLSDPAQTTSDAGLGTELEPEIRIDATAETASSETPAEPPLPSVPAAQAKPGNDKTAARARRKPRAGSLARPGGRVRASRA